MKKLFLLLTLIFCFSSITFATTFVVNSNGETQDADLGDNICTDVSGNCTLPAAVQQANASAGDDTITFAFATPTTINLSYGLIPLRTNITIIGPGARNLTIHGNNVGTQSPVIFVGFDTRGATVNISGLTLTGGNRSGIQVSFQNTLNLSDVVVKNNSNGTYGEGGGIYTVGGTLNILRCTINDNFGDIGGGIGIHPDSSAIVNIANSTISNNSARIAGAISAPGSFITLTNVTITNNQTEASSAEGSGVWGSALVRNSIIANNTSNKFDITGAFTSLGNNFIGNVGTATGFFNGINGDIVGTSTNPINPKLGALQNNGGQTDTHALLLGSPAINAGNNCVVTATCSSNNPPQSLTTDQRGFARIVNGIIDIGAFESDTPTPSCTYSISPNLQNFTSAGGDVIVTVTTQAGCSYSSTSNVPFITITSAANGSGNGALSFSVATNTGVARTGTISVAGQTFIVNQESGCTYTPSATSANFGAAASNGTFTISAFGGCIWQAVSQAEWITVNLGDSWSGSGTVGYLVAANPTNQPRTGTITVGGNTFTVTQAGAPCSYSLSQSSVSVGSAATGGVFDLSTSCGWTGQSNVDWISVFTSNSAYNISGTGNATVSYSVAANTGTSSRTGTVTVGGQTFTVNQAAGTVKSRKRTRFF